MCTNFKNLFHAQIHPRTALICLAIYLFIPNNCVISNNNIILINKLKLKNENVYLYGNKITNIRSFFLEPCDSRNLNIIVFHNSFTSDNEITISAEEVQTKCITLSISNSENVIIPLIHHR